MIRPTWRTIILGFAMMGVFSPFCALAEKDSEEEPRLPLAMEVFLKKPKAHQYDIHIHLTNMSPKTVTVDVHDLPWIPPNDSKWFQVLQMNDQRTPIQQRVFGGEFGSQPIHLVPGESVQNKIVLNDRIPRLEEEIRVTGIQVLWECPPVDLKFVCKSGAPRSVAISKGDSGAPDVYRLNDSHCRRLEQEIGFISIPTDHDVLFLLTTPSVMTDVKRMQLLLYQIDEYVQLCQPTWTNSWGVSFFTDRRYAGFLRDETGKRLFEDGLWQEANIGQYSSQIRTLYRFPWIKKQSNTVYLSFYHDSQVTQ